MTLAPSRQATWFMLILVIVLVIAYGNTFTVPFIFDDSVNIIENPSIRQLWPPWYPLMIPLDTGLANRPVVNLSLAINYALSGKQVWSYHFVNLIIHVLATLALFGILRRTIDNPWGIVLSFSGALLWGLHPLQTQAVTYIIQRCESLMGLFFLLTLYCALRGWKSRNQTSWHLAALLCFILAAGSKEVAVMTPVVLLCFAWVYRGETPLQSARSAPLLFGGFALGFVFAFLLAAGNQTFSSRTENTIGLGRYVLTQGPVILHYVRLALWPAPLTIDYGWPAATVAGAWPAVAAISLALITSLVALWKRRSAGFLATGFFLILAPTSLIPLPDPAFEHRMYLPLAFIILLILLALAHVCSGMAGRFTDEGVIRQDVIARVVIITTVLLALPLGFLTFKRNHDYRSALAIWSDVIAKRPDNFRGYHGLGLALVGKGKYEEGLDQLRHALQLRPANAYANNDTGYVLFLLKRPGEALPFLREAVRIKPFNAKAQNNLGAALAQTGNLPEALVHFSEALKIRPDYLEARNNLNRARSEQARLYPGMNQRPVRELQPGRWQGGSQ